MNSITRNSVVLGNERSAASFSDRATRVLNWIERAHSRRPRQEFWQSLRAQVRANGAKAS